MMLLFFDTETTGIPAGADNVHMVQLAWILAREIGGTITAPTYKIHNTGNFIIKPEGYVIQNDSKAVAVHGITHERALFEGLPLAEVLCLFTAACYFPGASVGHNIGFDCNVIDKEYERLGWENPLHGRERICTMSSPEVVSFCNLPKVTGGLKFPKLGELYRKLFDKDFANAHDALADIQATMDCYASLREQGVL